MLGLIRASERLLDEAADAADGTWLCEYLQSRKEDEAGHAKWLLEDLASAGVTDPPMSHYATMVAGSQYYWIHHVDPVAFLGYMALLEGNPFPIGNVLALEHIHGKDLVRTLRYHAEHDVMHRDSVFGALDRVQKPDYWKVLENMAACGAMLATALREEVR